MSISVVAVCLFLLTGVVIYMVEKKYFWYCAMLYVAQLWTIVSCAYIESGIYITEQQVDSFTTGATWRLVLFNIIFFLSYIVIIKIFDRVIFTRDSYTPHLSQKFKITGLLVIFVSVLLLYINIIQSGIPLFSGSAINKFTFWKESAIYPEFARFLSYSPFYGFILGFIYSTSTDKLSKRSSLAILAFYVLYQVLEGHKFSLPYATIVSFLIPFIPGKVTATSNSSLWQKGKLLLGVVVGVMIVFELSKFYSAFNYVEDTTSDVLYRIFGLQGHVWWGTDLLAQTTNIDHYGHFVAEMREIFNSRELPIDVGILFLTILLGGDTGYDFVVRIGGAYTMGYPAIILYTFGTWGTVLVQIFFSIILALLISALHFHIKSAYLIRSVLLYKLLWSTFNLLTMGNFGDLFNVKNLIIVGIIIFISCINTVNVVQGIKKTSA